jgi:hypothetical protein
MAGEARRSIFGAYDIDITITLTKATALFYMHETDEVQASNKAQFRSNNSPTCSANETRLHVSRIKLQHQLEQKTFYNTKTPPIDVKLYDNVVLTTIERVKSNTTVSRPGWSAICCSAEQTLCCIFRTRWKQLGKRSESLR